MPLFSLGLGGGEDTIKLCILSATWNLWRCGFMPVELLHSDLVRDQQLGGSSLFCQRPWLGCYWVVLSVSFPNPFLLWPIAHSCGCKISFMWIYALLSCFLHKIYLVGANTFLSMLRAWDKNIHTSLSLFNWTVIQYCTNGNLWKICGKSHEWAR